MSSLEKFQAIQKTIVANRERKISISEISRITSINRNQVKKLIQRYDSSNQLSEFIVDGRKVKFTSKLIIPKLTENKSKAIGTEEVQAEEVQAEEVQTEDVQTEDVQTGDVKDSKIQSECTGNNPNGSVNAEKEQIIMYSELCHRTTGKLVNSTETQKFVFDSTITELSVKQFGEVLQEIVAKGIKPKFCVYANDVLELDMKKKRSRLARELLKFFAQDNTLQFHELMYTERPDQKLLAQICSQNKYTLISGNARNILWCKLYNADVMVPNSFKTIVPNPCKGKGIVGLDSCMIGLTENELNSLLKAYESILISDIQLGEIKGNSKNAKYLLNLVAYYGEAKFANKTTESADKNICMFYSQNNVEAMYTRDYGCYLFGKLNRVNNCTLYKYSSVSESRFLSILNQLLAKYDEIKVGDVIILDDETVVGNYYEFDSEKFPNLSIFTPAGKRREGKIKKAYSQDYLAIHINSKTIVIAQITKQQKANIRYYGSKNDVPADLKKFLT